MAVGSSTCHLLTSAADPVPHLLPPCSAARSLRPAPSSSQVENKTGRLGFVAGLINQDKINGFERLLFRATRCVLSAPAGWPSHVSAAAARASHTPLDPPPSPQPPPTATHRAPQGQHVSAPRRRRQRQGPGDRRGRREDGVCGVLRRGARAAEDPEGGGAGGCLGGMGGTSVEVWMGEMVLVQGHGSAAAAAVLHALDLALNDAFQFIPNYHTPRSARPTAPTATPSPRTPRASARCTARCGTATQALPAPPDLAPPLTLLSPSTPTPTHKPTKQSSIIIRRQVTTRLRELHHTIETGDRHREGVLQQIAFSLDGWAARVRREKAIYHTLNKLSVDTSKKVRVCVWGGASVGVASRGKRWCAAAGAGAAGAGAAGGSRLLSRPVATNRPAAAHQLH